MPLNIKCKDCRDFAPAPNLPHKGVCKRMVLRCDPDEILGCGCFYPASNADRLRQMSDEKLAEFFGTLPCCPPGSAEELCYPENTCGADTKMMVKCWLNWLKSPVEEGE